MFKIYTDTSANLPVELLQKYDIEVVPFHYTIDDKELPSTSAFDGKPFYDAMRKGARVKTSMINSSAFCKAFDKSLSSGIDILYIGMSSGISGTYQASVTAAQEMRMQYPDRKIAVIDTRAASLGEGLLVLHGARIKETGTAFEEAVRQIEEKSNAMCQYFTVENLMYLKDGGRISTAAALVGNILHIKPILKGDEEGKIILHHKVRGRKIALNSLTQKYQELVADKNAPVGIAHADCLDDAELLADRIRKAGHSGEIIINCYEPVTGAHVGPGTIALFFYGVHR